MWFPQRLEMRRTETTAQLRPTQQRFAQSAMWAAKTSRGIGTKVRRGTYAADHNWSPCGSCKERPAEPGRYRRLWVAGYFDCT
jgi:hypothetical protein